MSGYVQGRNIVLLTRFASPQPDKVEETIRFLSAANRPIGGLVNNGRDGGEEGGLERADCFSVGGCPGGGWASSKAWLTPVET